MVRFLSIALSVMLVTTSVHARRSRILMPAHKGDPLNPGNPGDPIVPLPPNPVEGENPGAGTCSTGTGFNNDAFGRFTGIFFGDFTTGGGTDILGPLAVGGDLNTPNYIINANHGADCSADPSSLDSIGLVVGGTASGTTASQVHGNALIAGGGDLSGLAEQEPGCQVTSDLGTGDFDFAAVQQSAKDTNRDFANMSPTAVIEEDGTITHIVDNPDYEVITMGECGAPQCSPNPDTESDPSSMLFGEGNWNGWPADDVDPNKTYVINVPVHNGGEIDIDTNNPMLNLDPCKVVWNIYPVDDEGNYMPNGEITVHRNTANQFGGFTLAPNAHIIDGTTGNFSGNIVGADYTWDNLGAGVEIHDYSAIGGSCDSFEGCNPDPDITPGDDCTNTTTETVHDTTTETVHDTTTVHETTTETVHDTTTETVHDTTTETVHDTTTETVHDTTTETVHDTTTETVHDTTTETVHDTTTETVHDTTTETVHDTTTETVHDTTTETVHDTTTETVHDTTTETVHDTTTETVHDTTTETVHDTTTETVHDTTTETVHDTVTSTIEVPVTTTETITIDNCEGDDCITTVTSTIEVPTTTTETVHDTTTETVHDTVTSTIEVPVTTTETVHDTTTETVHDTTTETITIDNCEGDDCITTVTSTIEVPTTTTETVHDTTTETITIDSCEGEDCMTTVTTTETDIIDHTTTETVHDTTTETVHDTTTETVHDTTTETITIDNCDGDDCITTITSTEHDTATVTTTETDIIDHTTTVTVDNCDGENCSTTVTTTVSDCDNDGDHGHHGGGSWWHKKKKHHGGHHGGYDHDDGYHHGDKGGYGWKKAKKHWGFY